MTDGNTDQQESRLLIQHSTDGRKLLVREVKNPTHTQYHFQVCLIKVTAYVNFAMAQPCFCNLQIRFSAGKNPCEFVHLLGRVLMPSERNWDQQLTTFTGYCYGEYFGSSSYTNISDTEGFLKLF